MNSVKSVNVNNYNMHFEEWSQRLTNFKQSFNGKYNKINNKTNKSYYIIKATGKVFFTHNYNLLFNLFKLKCIFKCCFSESEESLFEAESEVKVVEKEIQTKKSDIKKILNEISTTNEICVSINKHILMGKNKITSNFVNNEL